MLRLTEFVDEARAKRLKFREILGRSKVTVMPGGFSPLYARMAEMIGFETFFVAGSKTAAFLYGLPDNGIIGLREIADHVRHVAARTTLPIFVDCDTGFGNAVNVTYTVEEIMRRRRSRGRRPDDVAFRSKKRSAKSQPRPRPATGSIRRSRFALVVTFWEPRAERSRTPSLAAFNTSNEGVPISSGSIRSKRASKSLKRARRSRRRFS